MSFELLNIHPSMVELLKKNGISNPTPIQRLVIPKVFGGLDLVVKSETGSGKTLAYLLPLLELIDTSVDALQTLIVVPTRELALQVQGVANGLAEVFGTRALAIYGGVRSSEQLKKLKHPPHLIVATPGRLMDFLSLGEIALDRVKHFVLDEADQLLLDGFKPEIEHLFMRLPGNRQTLFLSATLSARVNKLAHRLAYQPTVCRLDKSPVHDEFMRQEVVLTTDRQKFPALQLVLEADNPYLAIIFCRTKRRADELFLKMKKYGFNGGVIHSDISQNKRERLLKSFRSGDLQFLIATDVAARGLDIAHVTHIYNFDVPESLETYIHRIGRTARAGATGQSCTFIGEHDEGLFAPIKQQFGGALVHRTVKIGSKS